MFKMQKNGTIAVIPFSCTVFNLPYTIVKSLNVDQRSNVEIKKTSVKWNV